ncbi:hypothetical protein BDV24DRAFT_170409 [Aspergillus arachidicola]|uniref:Uncharacterized protein n=1 Tax=Aspergillus arachidicola TaxID=656916 RepID=A0A5N6XLU0_9EURO|nr:hypothetical protein BDV24DRAFT_170409 [Aspergillus arachidicola]
MPRDTQQPTEHKVSHLEKILDHYHHQKNGNGNQAPKDKPHGGEDGLRSELKKGEAACKQYFKQDEQLEQEGQTYGGLM